MQLINIGFGNIVSAERIISIVSPESAPIKRIVQEAKDSKKKQMVEAQEEEDAHQADFLSMTTLKIFELLDEVVHGDNAIKVKVMDYGLTKAGGKGSSTLSSIDKITSSSSLSSSSGSNSTGKRGGSSSTTNNGVTGGQAGLTFNGWAVI